MRLINVHDFSMKEFYGNNIPAYAILSHTWGDEEVLLSDWTSEKQCKARPKGGFAKICFCCKQAKQDGWDWAWVDTCCIDKTSSAELSEAINSMFQWYSRATICYAYLVDVVRASGDDKGGQDGDKDSEGCEKNGQGLTYQLVESRWFERGWTLQELIAPMEVDFFDRSWNFLGSKLSCDHLIHKRTRIPYAVLHNSAEMYKIPVGLRMNWAFDRETTREEDIAYCLLGIFDVNMPLLYGEGPKAFIRLQEEIIKHQDDPTLFLWSPFVLGQTRWQKIPFTRSSVQCMRLIRVPEHRCAGLLADNPRCFHSSSSMEIQNLPPERPWPLVSKRGVRIQLHLCSVPKKWWVDIGFTIHSRPRSIHLAALACKLENSKTQQLLHFSGREGDECIVALVLWQPEEAEPGVFYRWPDRYIRVSVKQVLDSWKVTSCLVLNSLHPTKKVIFIYDGLSIIQGDCETRLVASQLHHTMSYLLSTTHENGVLHTVVRLNPAQCYDDDYNLSAGRLPAQPSDEAKAKKLFQDLNLDMALKSSREGVRVTRPLLDHQHREYLGR